MATRLCADSDCPHDEAPLARSSCDYLEFLKRSSSWTEDSLNIIDKTKAEIIHNALQEAERLHDLDEGHGALRTSPMTKRRSLLVAVKKAFGRPESRRATEGSTYLSKVKKKNSESIIDGERNPTPSKRTEFCSEISVIPVGTRDNKAEGSHEPGRRRSDSYTEQYMVENSDTSFTLTGDCLQPAKLTRSLSHQSITSLPLREWDTSPKEERKRFKYTSGRTSRSGKGSKEKFPKNRSGDGAMVGKRAGKKSREVYGKGGKHLKVNTSTASSPTSRLGESPLSPQSPNSASPAFQVSPGSVITVKGKCEPILSTSPVAQWASKGNIVSNSKLCSSLEGETAKEGGPSTSGAQEEEILKIVQEKNSAQNFEKGKGCNEEVQDIEVEGDSPSTYYYFSNRRERVREGWSPITNLQGDGPLTPPGGSEKAMEVVCKGEKEDQNTCDFYEFLKSSPWSHTNENWLDVSIVETHNFPGKKVAITAQLCDDSTDQFIYYPSCTSMKPINGDATFWTQNPGASLRLQVFGKDKENCIFSCSICLSQLKRRQIALITAPLVCLTPKKKSLSQPAPALTILLHFVSDFSEGVWNSFGIPTTVFPCRMNTGDIFLFQNKSMLSLATKIATRSRWDHIAMVVLLSDKLFLLEATYPQGVQLYVVPGRLEYHKRRCSKIAFRRVYWKDSEVKRGKWLKNFHSFLKDIRGRDYQSDLRHFLKAATNSDQQVSMNDPMFCSMLISVAFKKLGAFPSTMSDYLTPKDFGELEQLTGPCGGQLGPIVQFSKKNKPPK